MAYPGFSFILKISGKENPAGYFKTKTKKEKMIKFFRN